VKLTDRDHCYTIDDFFSPGVVAGFTKATLKGNLSQDLKQALADLGKDFKFAHLKQIHSTRIHSVKQEGIYEGDGLFSTQQNFALVVRTADCLPLFFHSKKLATIGVIHMGWQGALGGILNNIEFNLSSFKVVIGVGLRKCCYALGKEFLKQQNILPFLERKQNSLYFDSVAFARAALAKNGIKEENIFDICICSFCSKQNFFSYRRDKTVNRTLSFILSLQL